MASKKAVVVSRRKSKGESKAVLELKKEVAALKKASSWSRLFAIGQEFKLFGEKVTRPFEQVSSVYKAIKAIADNVPQADLRFRDKKSKKEIEDDEIIELFNSPNPLMTESDFIQAWVGFHCLYGESFIVAETSIGQAAGTRKLPAELWPFNPCDFQEIASGHRAISGWRYTRENIVFRPEEVLSCKDFNPYSLFRGANPMKAIDKIIDIDWQSLIFNKAFFDNDATPGMMLSTEEELGEDVLKRLTAQFEARHKGAGKAFKVAVLEAGLKPVTSTPTHKDMDFIEQKRFSREEILGIWRAPKALFNITEDLNYATFMGQMKIFWDYAIMPVMRKIENTLNVRVVQPYNPKIEAWFDLSNVVAYQEALKDKAITAKTFCDMGFTRNEVNEKLNLGFEKVPWGDVWWAPFGLVPVSGAEEKREESPAEAPQEEDPAKSMFDRRKAAVWKGFLVKQGALEKAFSGALRKYFFEQRKESLSVLEKFGAEAFKLDWKAQDDKLKEKATKFVLAAVNEGVDFGKHVLGRKDAAVKSIEDQIRSYLTLAVDKITGINRTVENHLKDTLKEGLGVGETAKELADRVRDVYNMAAGRSILIARTETVGAVNGGSALYYESEGVRKKEWLTAHDENVRESHRKIDGEVVAIEHGFSNGLNFPGDQKGDPEEVCNCRCTLLPVVER